MKKMRKNITMFLVFAMILQMVVPVASNFVYGTEEGDTAPEEVVLGGGDELEDVEDVPDALDEEEQEGEAETPQE